MPATHGSLAAPALPVLYTFRRCPYAIRARLALRYAGIEVESREVELRNKPAALLAISPKATVPVLLLADGIVLDESLDIMRWALTQHDPEGWMDSPDAADMERWIALNDGRFKPLLDRYKYAGRYPELPVEEHRELALDALIRPLEERLQARPFLSGTRITLADAAIFPFVRQFALVNGSWFDRQHLPQLQQWLNGWLHSALFDSVMVRLPLTAPCGRAIT